jgi:hypothetical protein
MQKCIALAFLFLLPAAAWCQTTTVSGTVTDPNTLAYTPGVIKAQLVSTAGSPVTGQPTVTVNNQGQCVSAGLGSAPCKMPFQGTVGQFALDNTGSFTTTLQDNTQVTPAGTQWLFTVNSTGTPPPVGTGPQVCTAQLTISGASQTISSSFVCPALSHSGTGGVGPGTPTNVAFFATATTLASTIFLYDATDTSQTVCLLPVTNCIDLGSSTDGSALYTFGADGLQGSIMMGVNDKLTNFWQQAASFRTVSVVDLEPTEMGYFALEHSGATATGGNCFLGGASSLSCAVGIATDVGDDVVSRNPNANVQDAVGFHAQMSFNRSTPAHLGSVAGFFMATPAACAGTSSGSRPCGAASENAVNLWAIEVQDLQGRGTTSTAGVHIEAQTNPAAGNFAIKVEPNGGPVAFDKTVTALLANGATANVTLTVATGTVAMPTAAIAGGACSTPATGSVVTGSAANLLTSDVVSFSFSAGLPGINPGELTIPTTIASNGSAPTFEYCNETGAPVTPPATTLVWRVQR